MHAPRRVYAIAASLAMLTLGVVGATSVAAAVRSHATHQSSTATPIKHLVVIFDENISFDHYFGTYPHAANLPGEPAFHASRSTPTVNGLYNSVGASGPRGASIPPTKPGRPPRAPPSAPGGHPCAAPAARPCASTTHRPARPRPGINPPTPAASNITAGPPVSAGTGTTFSDADPTYDVCSYLPSADGGDGGTPAGTLTIGGNNIGAELTSANVRWGWFEGGFDNAFVPGHGTAPTTAQICAQNHKNVGGNTVTDYISHHEPFQYWASTANPMHLPPTSVAKIGQTDQANHQYDIADFWAAANHGNLPAVSYLKAPAYQDGHAGYSDPLDEQAWLAGTINHLESLSTWKSTAIVITYDDSDGWYDHVLAPITTQSQTALDTLTGTGTCGSQLKQVPMNSASQPEQGRCGLGVRMPFLVISPFAKRNFVDNTLIDQSSVVKFIEFNWGIPAMGNGAVDATAGSILSMFNFNGERNSALFLNPLTGESRGGR